MWSVGAKNACEAQIKDKVDTHKAMRSRACTYNICRLVDWLQIIQHWGVSEFHIVCFVWNWALITSPPRSRVNVVFNYLVGSKNFEIPPLHVESGYCYIRCKNTVWKIKEQFFDVFAWDPVCHQVLSGNYQLGICITPCYFAPAQAVWLFCSSPISSSSTSASSSSSSRQNSNSKEVSNSSKLSSHYIASALRASALCKNPLDQ